ncbi:hypothetical protein F4861DRAFT_550406 [Xylaria intraflava]|nr:hypothetical protein F4861DRAFT_550406 [Xylaria intraflava]
MSYIIYRGTWDCFPAEIRCMILDILLQDSCSLAGLATVSREWQDIIERDNFARIKLTPSRLADFGSIVYRNRAFVRYIWLCLELQEYNCPECEPWDWESRGFSNPDNTLIVKGLQNVFSALRTWEPNGSLVLDISVHSPSDSEHWFKYLTFGPDAPLHAYDRNPSVWQTIPDDDYQHGWVDGAPRHIITDRAIHKVFEDVMDQGPFRNDEQENRWWQELPEIPAVTGIYLRQQNRRRWKPAALKQLFARFPRLQEIHYEPWRQWDDFHQELTDKAYQSLFESLASVDLRKLVLFENFNQYYPATTACEPIRTPTATVGKAIAAASRRLEHLSASFIIDASHFFDACKPFWKWPNLTTLVLTSQLFTPDESPTRIADMLQAAAAVAMKMPKLRTMEIWNGRRGLAMLFRYQLISSGQRTVITWKGTWNLALELPVIRAWEAVALEKCGREPANVMELLDGDTVIRSHGDAIVHLQLSTLVMRPISLQQIQIEHKTREGLYFYR